MSTRILRRPFWLGILSIAILSVSASVSMLVPRASSAGAQAPDGSVLQPAADSILRLPIAANDIIYNPKDHLIYATRPSSVGGDGNRVMRINPLTGEVVGSVYVGSEPNKLALSDDGETLYITIDGAYAIRRYETSTQTPGAQFSIGRESTASNPLGSPYSTTDIAVAPGNPNVLAVARSLPGMSPPGTGVAIYDNGVRRPQTGPGHSSASNYLAFSSSPTTLYGGGYDEGLRTMTVDENGVTVNAASPTSFYVKKLKFENNLLFTSTGLIIDPQTRSLLGTCAGVNTEAFVPDTATGRVLYAVKDSYSSNITIKAFDINTFILLGSLTIPNTTGDVQPTALVRYGTNGLAMRTWDNQIYLIQTSLIPTADPLPTPTGTPAVTPTPTPTVYAKFVQQINLPNKDLIYSRTEQKFYASVPSTADAARANSVTRIDPATGTLESSVVVGTDPGRLALSDDDQTLYVGIDGANAVRKLDIQTQTPGLQFPLGTGVNGPKYAYDIDVMPGNPNSVAVSYGSSSYNYDGADIYDDGVKRSQKAGSSGSVKFGSPSLLYVGENWLYKYAVGPGGLTAQGNVTTNNYQESEFVGNLLYGWGGVVMDLETSDFKGSFIGAGNPAVAAVDPANNRIYFLRQGDGQGGSGWSIRAYRLDNYLYAGSISFPGLTMYGTPRRLFRWGDNGLAFNDYKNTIYLVKTDLVSSAGSLPTAVQLASQTYSGNESSGSLQVTVTRSGGIAGTTTVSYATRDETATAGVDYAATTGTLSFAPGETSKTVNIPLLDDNVYEGSETFSLVLSNPGGDGTVEIQNPGTAVVTILDNESVPTLTSQGATVNEPRISGITTSYVIVQLSNPTTQTATVSYATANGTATAYNDFVPVSGVLTFAPLETTKKIPIYVMADQNYNEPLEYFRIVLTNSGNAYIGTPQVFVNIINFDPQNVRHARLDFDDDGKTDISVFRPNGTNGAEWWYMRSSDDQVTAAQFGLPSDQVTAADYTGDGKTDIAFFRPSTGMWYVLRSEDGSFYGFPFGAAGDVPAPADYDGDGKADPAVFRPDSGTWFISRSSDGGVTIAQFGAAGDQPVAADYDGDGKADIAVWRPNGGTGGEWWISKSTGTVFSATFGSPEDKTVVGDWTGDGKADCAFFRPSNSTWYILRSEDMSYFGFPFGVSTDTPAPGDYDGDGKFDAAVFRSSSAAWYVNKSSGGVTALNFGAEGDQPVPNSYVR